MTEMAEPLLGEDLVLLMLAAPTRIASAVDRVNGITRLEKLLFLADKERDVQAGVEGPLIFQAYHYGPYSKKVYEAVDLLEEAGLVTEERRTFPASGDDMEELEADATDESAVERQFMLTPDGRIVADMLLKERPDLATNLGAIKDSYASLSLTGLIRYVYTRYEDYAVKSRIKDKVL